MVTRWNTCCYRRNTKATRDSEGFTAHIRESRLDEACVILLRVPASVGRTHNVLGYPSIHLAFPSCLTQASIRKAYLELTRLLPVLYSDCYLDRVCRFTLSSRSTHFDLIGPYS